MAPGTGRGRCLYDAPAESWSCIRPDSISEACLLAWGQGHGQGGQDRRSARGSASRPREARKIFLSSAILWCIPLALALPLSRFNPIRLLLRTSPLDLLVRSPAHMQDQPTYSYIIPSIAFLAHSSNAQLISTVAFTSVSSNDSGAYRTPRRPSYIPLRVLPLPTILSHKMQGEGSSPLAS